MIYAALVLVVPISSWLMARAAIAPVRRSYELQQRFVGGAALAIVRAGRTFGFGPLRRVGADN